SVMNVDSKFFTSFAYVFYGVTILLLMAVLVLGKKVNGARSWFEIGDFRLQPSEFAKYATVLAVSQYIGSMGFNLKKRSSILKLAMILAIPAILILLQPDAGSALVYGILILVLFREGMSGVILFFGFLIALLFILALVLSKLTLLIVMVLMCFVAYAMLRQRFIEALKGLGMITGLTLLLMGVEAISHIGLEPWLCLLGSSIFFGTLFFLFAYRDKIIHVSLIIWIFFGSILFTSTVDYSFHHFLEAHQQNRINDLLGISSDPLGAGWNVHQSMIAIGSGGFFGKGFLQGTQTKFDFVPEQSTDFIFCTVGEEWGFVGALVIISLFVFLLLRLLRMADRQHSTFSRVYGYGTACILFFHFAVNIAMTIKLAPVIGIPLPFFSYGGSSLWSFTLLLFTFIRLDANRLERF
ncbi:MAG: rod shape-determining protein RodA, partial [Bacteroidota bacterium]|nr:rod shape-determining protein RodA [Bacteroidota bacterium]